MMSSGSTVFFFDFDIFSMRADLDRLAGRGQCRAAGVADRLDRDVGWQHIAAVLLAIGFVDHHALREQAGERFVEPVRPVFFIARRKKRL